MTKQFSIKKIKNNIYIIEEKWFKEHANLYLFTGKKYNLLIDCGLGIFNIKEFLNKKGFKNIKVLLTHSHFDHAFGIRHFLPEEIIISHKVYKNLKHKRMCGIKYLKRKDFTEEVLSEVNFSNILRMYKNSTIFAKPQLLTKINVAPFCFEAVDMHGHTNDSTAYYDKNKGILITGDALYIGEIYFDFSNSNKKKFKKSLKNMAKLNFKFVLPGHNKIFGKTKALEIIGNWSKTIDKAI
jgi:glyoxylase-like metal-dependent hydrolase (beta-lactamase superfamily II)